MTQAQPDTLVVLYPLSLKLFKQRIALTPEIITLGRTAENTLQLEQEHVSRRHARIERRPDGWWLVDTASTSGTYVNEERITAVRLQHDDQIRVGGVVLRVLTNALDRRIIETVYEPRDHDGLTGALTLRAWSKALDEARPTISAQHPLSLVWINIARLSDTVNTPFGHVAGDAVICEVALRTQTHARKGVDLVVRVSGQEFVMMMPGTTQAEATSSAASLRNAFAAHPFLYGNKRIPIAIHTGVFETHDARISTDTLCAEARSAMLKAKA